MATTENHVEMTDMNHM
jgi:flagellar basal body-associated protein FliL